VPAGWVLYRIEVFGARGVGTNGSPNSGGLGVYNEGQFPSLSEMIRLENLVGTIMGSQYTYDGSGGWWYICPLHLKLILL
jgi:hypothetical protein